MWTPISSAAPNFGPYPRPKPRAHSNPFRTSSWWTCWRSSCNKTRSASRMNVSPCDGAAPFSSASYNSPMASRRMGARPWGFAPRITKPCPSSSVRGFPFFVCDNLAFRGDLIALRRKHTSGLNLRTELAGAVLRFQEHFGRLAGEVERLKRNLPDLEAKALIHDAFASRLMPVCFLPDVSQAYFTPELA